LPIRGRAAHAHLLVERHSVRGAEELAQIHYGRERVAGTGEHEHPAAVVDLERIEHLDHLVVERRAHAVAFLGPVERHPGDLVLERDEDVLASQYLLGRRLFGRSLVARSFRGHSHPFSLAASQKAPRLRTAARYSWTAWD